MKTTTMQTSVWIWYYEIPSALVSSDFLSSVELTLGEFVTVPFYVSLNEPRWRCKWEER